MLYFSLPFQDKIYTIKETSNNPMVTFFSFDGKKKLDFNGEILEIIKEDFLKKEITTTNLPLYNEDKSILNKNKYLEIVENIIQFIITNDLDKLVFSRKKILSWNKIDLKQSFLQLKNKYPNAFTYLFNVNGNCWIGSFSELLGKYNKSNGEFETMSLAGTLPLVEKWSIKEIEEQNTVTLYIQKILSKYAKNIEESGPIDHISGNIKHLKTSLKIKITEDKLDSLISDLHPTPAVCGLPTALCKSAILDFENYDREFYAGYSRIETEKFSYFFVNLRCAKIFKNTLQIYVGGGITAKSNPLKEWRETELKSEAIAHQMVMT